MDVILYSALVILIVALGAVWHFRRRKWEQRCIYRWINEHGYGVISFYGLGSGAMGYDPDDGRDSYKLLVQDEQGGQITFIVTVGFTGKIRANRL